jgi:hypothetical protein
VIERDDVGGTFVVEERLVDAGHLGRANEVDGQFKLRDAELSLEDVKGDAAEQGGINPADALAVANRKRPAHLAWPRCSS